MAIRHSKLSTMAWRTYTPSAPSMTRWSTDNVIVIVITVATSTAPASLTTGRFTPAPTGG